MCWKWIFQYHSLMIHFCLPFKKDILILVCYVFVNLELLLYLLWEQGDFLRWALDDVIVKSIIILELKYRLQEVVNELLWHSVVGGLFPLFNLLWVNMSLTMRLKVSSRKNLNSCVAWSIHAERETLFFVQVYSLKL